MARILRGKLQISSASIRNAEDCHQGANKHGAMGLEGIAVPKRAPDFFSTNPLIVLDVDTNTSVP